MKDVQHFISPIKDFNRKSAPYQIEVFGWFLHEIKGQEYFSPTDIRACYDAAHMPIPNVSASLAKVLAKRPARAIRNAKGYKLANAARGEMEKLLPVRASSVATTALLDGLVDKITNPAHKVFLNEALVCFKHGAYRAAIVMMWNLTYSHVLDRIYSEHVTAFNGQKSKTYAKLPDITKLTDFEDYGERQVIEICRGARIFDATVCKILTDRLNRRNSAAHPSSAAFTPVQAEDQITDLVNNVLLNLNV
ncbi:hypothetical protein KPB04_13555 [Burkholderia cenocepacia]|uniref:hypothetical protein n=1 Tax=Burkholderia cenocepacia TaxID=95486 RepID=UPI0028558210|nr:hypothetical protein [Burkholderia cenocepacia]MDR8102757.1 hypothetical protein [Burkholderia cenocepacia]